MLHCAAAAGKLPLLQLLLGRHVGFLDAPPDPSPGAHAADDDGAAAPPRSLLLTEMGADRNDVYMQQPPLTYNARPVYIGLSHGLYVYWYEPRASVKKALAPGWCLSHYLGAGDPDFRLLLDEAARGYGFVLPLPSLEALHTEVAPSLLRRLSRKIGIGEHHTFSSVRRSVSRGTKRKVFGEAIRDLMAPEDGVRNPLDWAARQSADPDVADVDVLFPLDMGQGWLPQQQSLLEAAAASGDRATIRHVAGVYRARHPECLRWHYSLGHGLWNSYSNNLQGKICKALARGHKDLSVTPLSDLCTCARNTVASGTAWLWSVVCTWSGLVGLLKGESYGRGCREVVCNGQRCRLGTRYSFFLLFSPTKDGGRSLVAGFV